MLHRYVRYHVATTQLSQLVCNTFHFLQVCINSVLRSLCFMLTRVALIKTGHKRNISWHKVATDTNNVKWRTMNGDFMAPTSSRFHRHGSTRQKSTKTTFWAQPTCFLTIKHGSRYQTHQLTELWPPQEYHSPPPHSWQRASQHDNSPSTNTLGPATTRHLSRKWKLASQNRKNDAWLLATAESSKYPRWENHNLRTGAIRQHNCPSRPLKNAPVRRCLEQHQNWPYEWRHTGQQCPA